MKHGAITVPAPIYHLNRGSTTRVCPINGVRHPAAKSLGERVPLVRKHAEKVDGALYENGDFVGGAWIAGQLRIALRFYWSTNGQAGGLIGNVYSAHDPMYPRFAIGEWCDPNFAQAVWNHVNGQYIPAMVFHAEVPEAIDGDCCAMKPELQECSVIATLNPRSEKVDEEDSGECEFERVQHLAESLLTVAENWRQYGKPYPPKGDAKR